MVDISSIDGGTRSVLSTGEQGQFYRRGKKVSCMEGGTRSGPSTETKVSSIKVAITVSAALKLVIPVFDYDGVDPAYVVSLLTLLLHRSAPRHYLAPGRVASH